MEFLQEHFKIVGGLVMYKHTDNSWHGVRYLNLADGPCFYIKLENGRLEPLDTDIEREYLMKKKRKGGYVSDYLY